MHQQTEILLFWVLLSVIIKVYYMQEISRIGLDWFGCKIRQRKV